MKTFDFGCAMVGLALVAAAGCNGSSGTPKQTGTGGSGGTASGAGGQTSSGAGGMVSPAGAGGTGGTGTTPDAGAGGTGTGTGGRDGGVVVTRPDGGPPAGSCSETTVRTGPPPGKEMFKAAALDTKFPFSKHWMGTWDPAFEPKLMGMTSFSDLDNDGDLDFAAGQRDTIPGGANWWEYCTADQWVRHHVGSGHRSQAGGGAMDIDGDGWIDLIFGDSWYKNPKNPRQPGDWMRYSTGAPQAEEMIIGDVNGDGKHDILYLLRTITPQWWTPSATPTQPWTMGSIIPNTGAIHAVNQGGAWGDIDGDGKNDYAIGNQWWYRNVNGDGKTWETVTVTAGATFDPEPLTYIGDLDGDGDNDIMMATHWMGAGNTARMGWEENMDGRGRTWTMHVLTVNKQWSHGVIAADFDNDGDLDILFAQNVGPSYIYDNTDGHGAFVEHMIVADFRGHTPRVADVDCDGDLDIAGGPWGDQGQGTSGEAVPNPPIRDYLYLQNLAVDRGAKLIAQRKPNELGAIVQTGVCGSIK